MTHICVFLSEWKCVCVCVGRRVSHRAQLWSCCWVIHPPVYLSRICPLETREITPEQKTTSISKNILGTFTVLYSNSTIVHSFTYRWALCFLCLDADGLFCMWRHSQLHIQLKNSKMCCNIGKIIRRGDSLGKVRTERLCCENTKIEFISSSNSILPKVTVIIACIAPSRRHLNHVKCLLAI